jgi:hypothetical protein
MEIPSSDKTAFGREDAARQELAAIALAQFRADALPAIRMFLSSMDKTVRNNGVLAAVKLYEGDESYRKDLMGKLATDFSSPSAALKMGVLETYKEVMQFASPDAVDMMEEITSKYAETILKLKPDKIPETEVTILIEASEVLANLPRKPKSYTCRDLRADLDTAAQKPALRALNSKALPNIARVCTSR